MVWTTYITIPGLVDRSADFARCRGENVLCFCFLSVTLLSGKVCEFVNANLPLLYWNTEAV